MFNFLCFIAKNNSSVDRNFAHLDLVIISWDPLLSMRELVMVKKVGQLPFMICNLYLSTITTGRLTSFSISRYLSSFPTATNFPPIKCHLGCCSLLLYRGTDGMDEIYLLQQIDVACSLLLASYHNNTIEAAFIQGLLMCIGLLFRTWPLIKI